MKRINKFVCLILGLVLFTVPLAGCKASEIVSERYSDKSFTLYVGNISASLPTTYMPWLSNQGISTTISSALYSTLFSYDDIKGEYQPNLAKSWEYVVDPERVPESQDYLEVKVVLDENATWSDGEPVTSKDIYFTYDLAADFGRTNHAGALAWTGDLLHRYEKDKEGKWNLVRQGVFYKDYPGTYTFGKDEDNVVYLHVRKVLGAVTPLFTTVLMLPEHLWKVISPKNQLNSTNPIPAIKKLYDNPVGSGAFTLDTENSNASIIVLNKRSDFHLKDSEGNDYYKPDTIKFINYMDINVAINALKKGDIDVINSSIDTAYVDNLKKTKNVGLDYAEGLFMTTLVLNVNPPAEHSTPVRETLRNPKVREAIALSLDQEELIKMVLQGRGTPVSPGLVSSSASFYNPEVKIVPRNIDRAKELLEEEGYKVPEGGKYREKGGVVLSYNICASQGSKNLINYIKVQLDAVGIEVNFEEGGSNAVKDRYYTGDFDMTIQGVTFEMTNVDMMMVAHYVTLGSSSNYGRLNDPQLAAKIEDMRTTLSMDKKIEKLKELQADVAGHFYKLPLYCSDIISTYRTDLFEGWTTAKGSTVYNEDTLMNLKFK